MQPSSVWRRRLTDGPYDDIEPIYLSDGRIMFVSSRCNRIVACHTTDVSVLYVCDADGGDIRPRTEYVQQMQRYGVLPAHLPDDAPIDVYATDQAYWLSLQHQTSAR